MKFRPYTTSEILDYFEAMNCIQDVQIIGEYLNDNKRDYSLFDFRMFKEQILIYIDLFV